MLEARSYKLLTLVSAGVAFWAGLAWRTALVRTAAFLSLVFLSDWLTSFVLP